MHVFCAHIFTNQIGRINIGTLRFCKPVTCKCLHSILATQLQFNVKFWLSLAQKLWFIMEKNHILMPPFFAKKTCLKMPIVVTKNTRFFLFKQEENSSFKVLLNWNLLFGSLCSLKCQHKHDDV